MLGQRIQIVASSELTKWNLNRLVGREGTISSEIQHDKVKGCWIILAYPFANESEWFIPIQSIQILSNAHGTDR